MSCNPINGFTLYVLMIFPNVNKRQMLLFNCMSLCFTERWEGWGFHVFACGVRYFKEPLSSNFTCLLHFASKFTVALFMLPQDAEGKLTVWIDGIYCLKFRGNKLNLFLFQKTQVLIQFQLINNSITNWILIGN